MAIERLPVTKSQSLSVHFFFTQERTVSSQASCLSVYKWFKWCLNINKLPAPYMKTCALRQGQTKPCASKGCEGFAAAVVVANLVIMKRSSLQLYSKVVARLYLMSVDIKSNSFEVHSVVGRVHEPAAPNGFTANLNSHSVISLFECNLSQVQQGLLLHPTTSAAFTLSFIRRRRAKVSSRKTNDESQKPAEMLLWCRCISRPSIKPVPQQTPTPDHYLL